jgi:hypothetical protein
MSGENMTPARRSWEESLVCFQGRAAHIPIVPPGRRPADVCDRPEPGDDRFRGLRLADAIHEEVVFEDLTLPRTLFERCRFHGVSFRNTDLRLSCLAGNDWIDCDFTDAVLTCADLRDAVFFGCRFVNCRLVGADLRKSQLTACDFTGADLTGARMDRGLKEVLVLTEHQRRLMVDWCDEEDVGPDEEPDEGEED